MATTLRVRTLFICALAILASSGCTNRFGKAGDTSSQAPFNQGTDTSAMALIANDFVSAMRQISALAPASSTIELLRRQSADELLNAFQGALERSGYAVRWVGDPSSTSSARLSDRSSGSHLLQYRHDESGAFNEQSQLRFDIAVGDIEFRRSYTGLKDNQVQPVTPLYIRGADATHVVLNDANFYQASALIPIKTVPLTVPENINPLQGLVASASTANPLTVRTITATDSKNVFDLGTSNYANRLSKHEVVIERILTFPNDSLRMGRTNKQLLDVMVTRFNSVSDVFSVLGCSLGPTKLVNGNAALALGRASRVREALLFAGVDPHKILDEGCWAGDSPTTTLPRRGVVVTLNRQARNP